MEISEAVIDRLLSKVEKREGDGCWYWTDHLNRGYGQMNVGGKQMKPYRLSYEAFIGEIPDGLVIDHMCRNPTCINPMHLRAVTQRVNILCGDTFAARKKAQTHCLRGHPLVDGNIYYSTGGGGRRCCECRRMRGQTPEAKQKRRDYRAIPANKEREAERMRLWHLKNRRST